MEMVLHKPGAGRYHDYQEHFADQQVFYIMIPKNENTIDISSENVMKENERQAIAIFRGTSWTRVKRWLACAVETAIKNDNMMKNVEESKGEIRMDFFKDLLDDCYLLKLCQDVRAPTHCETMIISGIPYSVIRFRISLIS